MKNGVKDEIYYFLLDWKDKNLTEYQSIKGDKRLCDLSPYELNLLFDAIKKDTIETNYICSLAGIGFCQYEVNNKICTFEDKCINKVKFK